MNGEGSPSSGLLRSGVAGPLVVRVVIVGDIRSTRAWKALVSELCPPGSVCAICRGRRGPIQFGLRPRHPLGPSLDHLIPLSLRPDLALEPSNLQPAHFGCNAGKRDRVPRPSNLRGWTW